MEIGPYRVRQNAKLEYNEGSWDEFANLLFVDNPVGTGFSYVDTDSYLHELPEMATQMVQFLEKWFALFPEYQDDDVRISIVLKIVSPNSTRFISPVNHTLVNISHILHKQCSIETKTLRVITNGMCPVF